jgi:hypothetical protein
MDVEFKKKKKKKKKKKGAMETYTLEEGSQFGIGLRGRQIVVDGERSQ